MSSSGGPPSREATPRGAPRKRKVKSARRCEDDVFGATSVSYPKVLAKLYPDIQTLGQAVDLLLPFSLSEKEGSEASSQEEDRGRRGKGNGIEDASRSPSCSFLSSSRCGGSRERRPALLDEAFVAFDAKAPDLVSWFQRARNRKDGGDNGRNGAELSQSRLVRQVVLDKFKLGRPLDRLICNAAACAARQAPVPGVPAGARPSTAHEFAAVTRRCISPRCRTPSGAWTDTSSKCRSTTSATSS